ncbi:MAG: NAD-dependent epimerase/dehydratase family protein [Elusimicrobiales bacterium]|jgi:nucleoside-diphosphate-sugar epimerase
MNDRKKTVVITGGTGFIGGSLARALLAKSYNIRIFTRKPPRKPIENAQYSVVSFDDKESLRSAAEGADFIVHLAALLFSRTRKDFEKVNITGTANLVKAAGSLSKHPVKFIYLSSLAAGGPSPSASTPRNEALADAPVSGYGATKLGGEKKIRELPATIRYTVLRPPIVYGKNDSGVSTIADWVRKGFMVNAGASNGAFSFIHIDDLTAAVITAMEEPATDGQTYYVCENRIYAWRDFIGLLAGAMKVKMPHMLDLPKGLLYLLGFAYEAVSWLGGAQPVFNRDKALEGAAANWTASSAKWERDTGWKRWTSLEEGIKKTFS